MLGLDWIIHQFMANPKVAMTKMKNVIKGHVIDLIFNPICHFYRPKKGKVVFTSYYGRGFSCNPKYIALEMHKRKEFNDLVWLVNPGEEASLPEYIRPVRYGGLRAAKELASAQVWIDNCRSPRHVRKREGQYYVQAWHGSMGPKRIESEAVCSLSPRYIKNAKRDSAEADLMFANSDMGYRLFTECFWYSGTVIRCGIPRNRPLLLDLEASRVKVFEHYSLPEEKSLCLYAPTFRNFGSVDVYRFDYDRVRTQLSRCFGREFVFAVRLHPSMVSKSYFLDSTGIIDMSSYSDSQELVAAADVLITDYSSILDDHIITKRPSFLYVPDYEEYIKHERNLNCTLEERPAPSAKTEDELVKQIADYSYDIHMARIDEYLRRWGFQDDGHGSEAVVDRIISDLSDMEGDSDGRS